MKNYALDVLSHQLDKLNYGYDGFVKNGDVDPNSKVAKYNREKIKSIEEAIKKIKASPNIEEKKFTMPRHGLICPRCGSTDVIYIPDCNPKPLCLDCNNIWSLNCDE